MAHSVSSFPDVCFSLAFLVFDFVDEHSIKSERMVAGEETRSNMGIDLLRGGLSGDDQVL